jgi:hypothetical protein
VAQGAAAGVDAGLVTLSGPSLRQALLILQATQKTEISKTKSPRLKSTINDVHQSKTGILVRRDSDSAIGTYRLNYYSTSYGYKVGLEGCRSHQGGTSALQDLTEAGFHSEPHCWLTRRVARLGTNSVTQELFHERNT